MPHVGRLAGFILAMLFSIVVCAQDSTSAKNAVDSVRWENLRGGSLWISDDPQPQLDKDSGFHEVKLSPGKNLILQVPSGSALRISSRDGHISANDLKAFVSNGDALYIDTQWYESSDSRSLVLRAEKGERLLQIERPVYADKPLHFVLFLSIDVTDDAPYGRREPLDINGRLVELKRDDETKGQSFWLVDGGQAISLDVEGPARLYLQSRLRYTAGVEQLRRLMTIETLLDGQSVESVPYVMGVERQSITVNGCAEVTGSLRGHIFDVPQGNHVVSFVPEFPVYARVSLSQHNDFLFPALNRLSIPLEDGDAGFLGKEAQQELVRDSDLIARDNSYRDSGLAAAAKAREITARNPGNDELVSLGRYLEGRYTVYHNIVPRNISDQEISLAWPKTKRLLDIEHEGSPVVVDAELLPAMLSNLSLTQFTRIRSKSVNDYRLPQRQYPTTLRLLVKLEDIEKETKFRVQLGTEDAREIRVSPAPLPPSTRYLTSRSYAGVMGARLQQRQYHIRSESGLFRLSQSQWRGCRWSRDRNGFTAQYRSGDCFRRQCRNRCICAVSCQQNLSADGSGTNRYSTETG